MCLYLCKGTVVNWDISPVTVSRHYVVIVTNTINIKYKYKYNTISTFSMSTSTILEYWRLPLQGKVK